MVDRSFMVTRKDVVVRFRYTDNRDDADRPIEDGDAGESIIAFSPGGATAYIMDLRDQLDRCATVDRGDGHVWYQTIVGDNFDGDESLIWQKNWTGPEPGGTFTETELIAVVRLGDVLVVVDAFGKKVYLDATTRSTPVDRALVDRLVAAAVDRARVLRY
jgi:hypothetical protein